MIIKERRKKVKEGSRFIGQNGKDRDGERLTACITAAHFAGHPEVGGSCVKGDLKVLRRCSNTDWSIVLHLMGTNMHA